MDPKVEVSVILSVFNADKFIAQAVKSVLNQTFKDLELIIIDDASTDNTAKILQSFDDPRIILIKQKCNIGLSSAKNIGLEIARGEWVAFIDADDGWHEERLSKLLELSEQYPNVFFASNIIKCFSGPDNELVPWRQLSLKCPHNKNEKVIIYQTIYDFVKYGFDAKPIFPLGIINRFNIRFRQELMGEEWLEFMLRFYQEGLRLAVLNEPLYFYRISANQLSSTYKQICNQLESITYLQSLDWIDAPTQGILMKKKKAIKHRFLTTALREKRWKEALRSAVYYPTSIFYLFCRIPFFLFEKYYAYRASKG